MWDLAISDHGDLILSGHRDLQGRSGSDLIEQRMRLRMMVTRGAWPLDSTKTFGSNLSRLIGMSPQAAAQAAPAFVQEALRGIDEIIVDAVAVEPSDHDLKVNVLYRMQDISQGFVSSEELQLTITLPVSVSGSGVGEE